ncbi:MAG: 30S ribosomal protein S8 [candidate division Zixibacteria bacterium]|nr:30S ribosomal protein S8 [candidate division Zixibacteria bacterium]
MSMTDPIADLLTRLRNASRAGHKRVSVPSSRMKRDIVRLLQDSHFVRGFSEQPAGPQNELVIRLRYTPEQEPVITGIRRLSRPGLRRYATRDKVKELNRRLGVTIVTTSRGVMTTQQAMREGIGGELLCHVW